MTVIYIILKSFAAVGFTGEIFKINFIDSKEINKNRFVLAAAISNFNYFSKIIKFFTNKYNTMMFLYYKFSAYSIS